MTELRIIQCNACGSSAHKLLDARGEYTIVRCEDCGLVFINPMPFFDKSDFHIVSSNCFYTAFQRELVSSKLDRARTEFLLQAAIWNPMLKSHGPRALVDVGCGPGLFVKAALDTQWLADGCDIDQTLVELGNCEFDLDLKHADLPGSHYASDAFDVVRFKYVMEHLPNPYEILLETKRILKPGGITLVIVPNEAGLLNQLRLMVGGRRKGKWGTLEPKFQHLHAHSPVTLRRMLERAGLEVVLISTTSPMDRTYCLYQYLEQSGVKWALFSAIFEICRWIGRGSVLVAFARKPE